MSFLLRVTSQSRRGLQTRTGRQPRTPSGSAELEGWVPRFWAVAALLALDLPLLDSAAAAAVPEPSAPASSLWTAV